jgi:hypothetical protein
MREAAQCADFRQRSPRAPRHFCYATCVMRLHTYKRTESHAANRKKKKKHTPSKTAISSLCGSEAPFLPSEVNAPPEKQRDNITNYRLLLAFGALSNGTATQAESPFFSLCLRPHLSVLSLPFLLLCSLFVCIAKRFCLFHVYTCGSYSPGARLR